MESYYLMLANGMGSLSRTCRTPRPLLPSAILTRLPG